MPKLPILSGKIIIKKLEKCGYAVVRQKGSHIRLRHNDPCFKPVTVPLHKTINWIFYPIFYLRFLMNKGRMSLYEKSQCVHKKSR